MHSSMMCSMHCSGCLLGGGGVGVSGHGGEVVSGRGGLPRVGEGVSAQRGVNFRPVDRQTPVKT